MFAEGFHFEAEVGDGVGGRGAGWGLNDEDVVEMASKRQVKG